MNIEDLNPIVSIAIRGKAREYLEVKRAKMREEAGVVTQPPLGRWIGELIMDSTEFKEWEASK